MPQLFLVAALSVATVVYLFALWRIAGRLSTRDSGTWARLGSPSPSTLSPIVGFRLFRFVWANAAELGLGYLGIGRLLWTARIAFLVGIATASALLVLPSATEYKEVKPSDGRAWAPTDLAGFLLITSYFLLVILMVWRVRRRHPQVWDDLGQPSFLNLSLSVGVSLLTFVFSRQGTTSGDPVLAALVVVTRAVFLVTLAFLLWSWFG